MKKTRENINRWLVVVGLISCVGFIFIAYSYSQKATINQNQESTAVKIVLLDYSSKPLSNAPVMINEFPNYTDIDGTVDVDTVPTGDLTVSVEWKGSKYTWPSQAITAQDNQQLLSYRLPFFDSYGVSSQRLIFLGILLTCILLIISAIKWLLNKYKEAKVSSDHDARTNHHISKRAINKAAISNVITLSVSPQIAHNPVQHKNPIPPSGKTSPKPVQSPTQTYKPSSNNPTSNIKTPSENNQIQQAHPPQAVNQQANPLIKKPTEIIVKGERLPTGIEVHDLTE